MNRQNRSPLVFTLLFIFLGAATALALLTILHAQLDQPLVLTLDHGVQTQVHTWTAPWLSRFMLALTWIGSVKIFLTSLAIVLCGLIVQGRKHATAILVFAMTGALALNELLKLHFHRARPVVPWSIGDEKTFSFPSGHSLFSVVLYGTLAYLALRRGVSLTRRAAVVVPATLLPLGIGLSRIYLGMHWPTDVLAGYTVGLVWLAVTIAVDHLWTSRPLIS